MKGVGGFFLHGNETPDNFIQNEGPSVHFDVPQFNGDDFLGVNVSCVYSSLRDDFVENCSVKFVNYSKGFRRTIIQAIPMVKEITFGRDHCSTSTSTWAVRVR